MHSLRPHNHLSVHLTVTVNYKSNLKKKRFRVFQSFSNRSSALVVQFFTNRPSLPETLLLSRHWKRLVGVFLWGKRTIDSMMFEAHQLQQNAMFPPWPSLSASYSHIEKRNDLKSHWYTQTKPNIKRLLCWSFKQFERHIIDSYEVEHGIDATTAPNSKIATSPTSNPNQADNGSDSKLRSSTSEA